jgi:hypothetical protein
MEILHYRFCHLKALIPVFVHVKQAKIDMIKDHNWRDNLNYTVVNKLMLLIYLMCSAPF